jgi:hypothetical protein
MLCGLFASRLVLSVLYCGYFFYYVLIIVRDESKARKRVLLKASVKVQREGKTYLRCGSLAENNSVTVY